MKTLLSHCPPWSLTALVTSGRTVRNEQQAPLGRLPGILFLAPHSVPSCSAWAGDWWFSPVATISGSDTLIEPHCFQVCGTLRGRRAGGSCVFNYCRPTKECSMACSSVHYHPFPGWPQAKTIGLCPRSWCAGWEACEPHCGHSMCSRPGADRTGGREGGAGAGRSML